MMMQKGCGLAIAGGLVVMGAISTHAQTPATPTHRLAWDQCDTDAASLEYWISVDGAALTQIAGVDCTQPAQTCTAAGSGCVGDLPALTPGTHSLTLLARRIVNGTAFDSPFPATPLDIVFAPLPATPRNFRVEPIPE